MGRCWGRGLTPAMLLAILAVMAFGGARVRAEETAPRAAVPQTLERSYGAYSARIIGHPGVGDGARLEIRREGAVVFSRKGTYFEFPNTPPPGTDLTGDGRHYLVVTTFSGGAHCCYETWGFALGPELYRAFRLPGGDAQGEFVEEGGRWIYGTYDWTFSYWNASFADSTACKVWLGYREGAWRLLAERLRRPSYPQAKLERLAMGIRNSRAWRIAEGKVTGFEPRLWAVMLDLVYTGNRDQALAFLDRAWPPEAPQRSKRTIRRAFLAQLRLSPYRHEIADLPHLPPQPLRQDKALDPVCTGPA